MRAGSARLRWRCRRGTREMDLLLLRFLEQGYPRLNPAEKTLFAALLDEADPDLYAWLTGQSEPADPDYLTIIGKINNCSRSDATKGIIDRPIPARSQSGDCPASSEATKITADLDRRLSSDRDVMSSNAT